MKDLIKYIAEALVDYPEQVEVSEVEGEQALVIELKVAKDDLGKIKVIGPDYKDYVVKYKLHEQVDKQREWIYDEVLTGS